MERFLEKNTEKSENLARFTMALASVQGSWNPTIRKVLQDGVRGQVIGEDAGLEGVEKVLMRFVVRLADGLIGEGSLSEVILKRNVLLPPEDGGLIVVGNLFGVLGSEESHDWEISAILVQNIKDGHTFDETVGNLRKSFEKFNRGLMGIIKNFVPDDETMDSEEHGEFVIKGLTEIYGGNDEALKTKKSDLERIMIGRIEKKLGSMTQEEIIVCVKKLNVETTDKVVSNAVASAKDIIRTCLVRKSQSLATVIENIR